MTLLVGAFIVTVVASVAAGAAPMEEVTVVREGDIGQNHWTVEAAPEGKGICFEVGVVAKQGNESGKGQCSFPAPRRGILLVGANPLRHRVAPAMMVVGGAFNPIVQKVLVQYFNGTIRRVPLFRVDSDAAPRSVARFRYIAFAVRGPWCARSLTTYGRNGKQLWRAGWEVFDSAWHYKPFYNPGVLCRR